MILRVLFKLFSHLQILRQKNGFMSNMTLRLELILFKVQEEVQVLLELRVQIKALQLAPIVMGATSILIPIREAK